MAEIVLNGKIKDFKLEKEEKRERWQHDFVHFTLYDDDEHSIMKQMRCYCFPPAENYELLSNLDVSGKWCVRGVICSDEQGTVDFQVHEMWREPETISMS